MFDVEGLTCMEPAGNLPLQNIFLSGGHQIRHGWISNLVFRFLYACTEVDITILRNVSIFMHGQAGFKLF